MKTENIISADFVLTQAVIDEYQERAAIMEFDAGMSRKKAEAEAFESTKGMCYDEGNRLK